MPQGIKITPELQDKILKMGKNSYTVRDIADLLGVSIATVHKYLDDCKPLAIRQKHESKKKISKRNSRFLIKKIKSNRKVSLRSLANSLPVKVSHMTIKRHLDASNIIKKKLKRKPILEAFHKTNRINFARNFIAKNYELKNIIFTDEKKFKFDGPDGFNYFWYGFENDNKKNFFSKDYRGYKGVMVWLGISKNGIIYFEKISGKFNGEKYYELIKDRAYPEMEKAHQKDFILQHDNATPHTKKTTIQGIQKLGIEILDFPSLSPDLNPVENVWALIARRVYQEPSFFNNEDELWKKITEVISKIKKEEIKPFIDSMKNRCMDVLEKQGDYVQNKY